MNNYEEELQDETERGRNMQGDSLDKRAYRQVFRALKRDPGYTLDADFAERVAETVAAGKRARESSDYVWFAGGIGLLLVAFALALVYTGFHLDLTELRVNLGFLSVMSDYKGLAIFGILFILLLHGLDKSLVKRQTQN